MHTFPWGDYAMRMLRKLIGCLFVFSAIAIIMFFLFRNKYHDVIRSLTQTQVKNATSDLINDAIDRQIRDGTIQYDRMVYFEKDLEGKITALKTNMSEVNRLKTDILNIILRDCRFKKLVLYLKYIVL